ncbi:class I SAM-dependent methyltransferase [Verrucomicrobium sp. BvORR034]|uniref:class I SAM-dependent methyltransferase n=1 Tax=Verrucomicrobium sp. BvORR034 TaxID=1396418 RepID=UPI00067957FC|nr:class I SAM-dependent methyltransferase [Verrucomicrobium sp. BvORR034]
MNHPESPFSDPKAVADYAAKPPRLVPGFASLQRMTALLLAERTPATGRVLVLGAGGGLELKEFATAHPGWEFDGVDPSAEMLKLASDTLGTLGTRVRLHQGYIDTAPAGPFDSASCLLTLHFVPREERLATLRQVHQRLKSGAPFVVAHLSFPQAEPERSLWFSRYVSFAVASGVEPAMAEKAVPAIQAKLDILDPAEEEALLREAGFTGVSLFYTGFTFRGWVAYA